MSKWSYREDQLMSKTWFYSEDQLMSKTWFYIEDHLIQVVPVDYVEQSY